MPLINTVIELAVKAHREGHLIVQESDGTEYRFDPGRDAFVENETIRVRVDGMDRNLELGRMDQLLGTVVDAEMAPGKYMESPIEIVETGTWDPTHLYGPTAAAELFPKHAGRTFRTLTFSFTKKLEDADIETINAASELLQQGNHDEAAEVISPVVGRIPWLLDLYHVLGVLAASHKRLELARKYFEMGCTIAELSLPDTDDFVLDHREPANSFYQSHLHSLGDMLLQLGRQEQAIEAYEKCYRLTPQDPGGVRIKLQKLTGEEYPCTSEQLARLPVDPYYLYFNYDDMPIRDGYDPNSRPDYDTWLRWEDSYRRLLILLSHQGWFISNKMKPEDVDLHLSLHDLTETALARNEPAGFRANFARIMAEGHSRHDALHIVGDMLLRSMAKAQQDESETE